MNGHPDSNIRKEYSTPVPFAPHEDPFTQFELWFADAKNSAILEPNAMVLATCSAAGEPSARLVLLKGFDKRGFVFFSNYCSAKALELEENPYAALVFYWDILERQVRARGKVSKVSVAESTEYFKSRPRGAQISAAVSTQSAPLDSRENLINSWNEFSEKYKDKEIPLPQHWGGYVLSPIEFEFWQGAKDRMHERVKYLYSSETKWEQCRLWP